MQKRAVRLGRLLCFLWAGKEKRMQKIAVLLSGSGRTLDNFHENNFWYDRIMEKTDFYNQGVFTIHGDEYTMSPYHSLYPP